MFSFPEFHAEGGILAWHSASPLTLGSYRKVGSRDANELFCDYDRFLELAITHTIRGNCTSDVE